MRPLIAGVCLLGLAVPLVAQQPAATPATPAPVALTAEQSQRIMDVGKQATSYFMTGKADSLALLFSADELGQVGGVAGIRQMLDQIAEHAGVPQDIVEQKLTRRRGQPQVWTEIRYSNLTDDTLVVRWIVSADGKITGAGMNPKSAAPLPDPLDR